MEFTVTPVVRGQDRYRHTVPIPTNQAHPDDGTLELDPTINEYPETNLDHNEWSASIYAGMPGYSSKYNTFYFKDYAARRSQLEIAHDMLQYFLEYPETAKTKVAGVLSIGFRDVKRYMVILEGHNMITVKDKVRSRKSRRGKAPTKIERRAGSNVKVVAVTEWGIVWLKMMKQCATMFYDI